MRNKNNFKNKGNENHLLKRLIRALPIIIFACITPLLAKATFVTYPHTGAIWNPNEMSSTDIFNYCKFISIIVSGVLTTMYLFIYTIPNKKFWKNNWSLWAVVAFLVILLFSSLVALNPKVALLGMIERHEGVFVWLCYLLNALYIAIYSRSVDDRLFLLRGLLLSGLIIATIGALQFFGIDLFRVKLFQYLYLPASEVGKAEFSFAVNRVYSTLYNPNYVAQYVSMMLPLSLIMIYADKSKWFKGFWLVYSAELVVCLLGSEGRGGLLGLFSATIAFLVIVLIKKLEKPKLGWVASGLALVLCITLFSALSNGKISTVFGDQINQYTQLEKVDIVGEKVTIQYAQQVFSFSLGRQNPNIIPQIYTVEEKPMICTMQEDNFWVLNNPKLAGVKFGLIELTQGQNAILFVIDGDNWIFKGTAEGVKYINQYGVQSNLSVVKHLGFEGSERVGSNRGYIWSRTLPLIAKAPLIGNGADNFSLIFPQEEYLLKQQLYGKNYTIVDKPHNMYLQILVAFGFIGFISLVIFIGSAVKESAMEYLSNQTKERWVSLAILMGIFGYLGAGLFYDSNVNVSPVFWALVGLANKNIFEG